MNKKASLTETPLTLNQNNYYESDANWQYMSVSQYKDFMQCEAAALEKLKGDWEPKSDPTPLLVGNYVHSYFENKEEHEKFKDEHQGKMFRASTVKDIEKALDDASVAYKKSGNKSYKETIAKENGVKIPKGDLLSDFRIAEQMIARIKDEEFFNFLWQGERETIVKGELYGVEWKGKIDLLNVEKGYFVDLKTTAQLGKRFWSTKYNTWVSFIEEYGYVLQMAVYEKLLEQQYGKPFKGFIYAVTKQTPSDISAIKPEELKKEFELGDLERSIDRVTQVKMGEVKPEMCGSGDCEYCREHKSLSGFITTDDLLES